MKKVRVCVIRSAGTNCDKETANAFKKAGSVAELVHINTLVKDPSLLARYRILALPGGFSYGDDVASGKIFANELKYKLFAAMNTFVADGKLIIGICNGFQILVKAGLLPGNGEWEQEATLTINDSGKFEDRWVHLRAPAHTKSVCIWTKGLPETIYLPVAHGEGKFVPARSDVLARLKEDGQVVLQYCDETGALGGYPVNPNGAIDHIAGICDQTGRIFGLMPHPERHVEFSHHPRWAIGQGTGEGDGMQIFRNGVKYAGTL